MALRQVPGGLGRAHSLGDSRHPREDFVQALAASNGEAHPSVAAEVAGARQDEISNSRQPGEGGSFAPQPLRQAADRAITFFSAPPSSVPMRSDCVYRRK